jgi:TRAP-type uncharacterized transport system fused permease subunit
MAEIGQPMSLEAARALVALVPPEIGRTFAEGALSREALTVALLSAHMIIFWMSQSSGVTPPVCLTAFAAAAIAKTPPMATGFVSLKLAKGLYIVPLLFAFTPMMGGNIWHDIEVAFFALFAIYAIGGAIDGHLEAPVGWILRPVLLLAGAAMMWPENLVAHVGGLAVFAAIFALNLRTARRTGSAHAAA